MKMNDPVLWVRRRVFSGIFAATSALALVGMCGLLGCRINTGAHGGDVTPALFDPPAADAGLNVEPQGAASGSGAQDSGATPDIGSSGSPALAIDAGSSAGPLATADAGTLGVPSQIDDAGSTPRDAAQSCGRSADSAVCDPIGKTGCPHELGMQCDVDLLASKLSGVCVFSAPSPGDAGSCLNIAPTESCPPGQTCIDGAECRSVCLCDTDCAAGSCCRKPIGNGGFKLCEPC